MAGNKTGRWLVLNDTLKVTYTDTIVTRIDVSYEEKFVDGGGKNASRRRNDV